MGGGHRSVNMSLDKESRDALAKLRKKGHNVSDVVDEFVHIIARQIDPGPSAPVLHRIDALLKQEVDRAGREGDYEKVVAVSMIGTKLKPYFDLAEVHKRKPGTLSSPKTLQKLTPSAIEVLLADIPREISRKAGMWLVEFQGDLDELAKKVQVGARLEGDANSLYEFIHWFLRARLGDELGVGFSFTDGGMEDQMVDARYMFRWKLGTPMKLNYPVYWKLVSLQPLATSKGMPLQGKIFPAVWFMIGKKPWVITYGRSGPTFQVSSQQGVKKGRKRASRPLLDFRNE